MYRRIKQTTKTKIMETILTINAEDVPAFEEAVSKFEDDTFRVVDRTDIDYGIVYTIRCNYSSTMFYLALVYDLIKLQKK